MKKLDGSGNNKTKKKEKCITYEKHRVLFKEKLISGCYSPLQYLKSIGCTIGNDNYGEELDLSDIFDSESSHETEKEVRNTRCVVCLQRKDVTYLFLLVDMRTVVEIAVTGWNNRISAAQPAVLKLRVDYKYF